MIFFLLDKDDTLVWTWNEKTCVPFVKLVYEALLEERVPLSFTWWHSFLWKGNMPIKLKFLF